MSENSAAWNMIDSMVTSLASELTESLETDAEPDWQRINRDLNMAQMVTSVLASDQRNAEAAKEPQQ